ncbi:MAG: hypothetical protein ACREIT_09145, partial [Tepidisphaeraceae bacterium]
GPGAPELQVFVVNVSIHGAGFRCPVSFDLGAKYDMRIGNGPLFLSSRVRIISSRRRKDGTFDVGAEFF